MKTRTMLRPVVLGAAVFALVLVFLGCAARASKTNGKQTIVPSQVREAIVKDYPGMAFLPGRLPSGYRYTSWNNCANRLCYAINFRDGSVKNQVELQVQRQSCPHPPKYPAKDTHTLRVNDHALKWLQSGNSTSVWRCMTNQGRSFVIFGLSLSESRQKAAELVGYAVPAH